jgi:hypothetical protein
MDTKRKKNLAIFRKILLLVTRFDLPEKPTACPGDQFKVTERVSWTILDINS